MPTTASPPVASADYRVRLSNSKTLSANNTTANVAVFRVTGTVLIKALYGIVTTVLGSNNTAAKFRLNDQTAQIDLTLAAGTTLSSAPVGSLIAKTGPATAAIVLKSSAAGAIIDSSVTQTNQMPEWIMMKKSGANTDIEFTYTTTNTPTSGVIQFFVEYTPLSADGAIAAV